MKTVLSSRRHYYMARVSIFLITIALIVGMVGCVGGGGGVQYDLTIDSTAGGSVTTPGEGTFTYAEGTVVNLVAEAEEDYYFAKWTGDVGTIDDVNAAATNITMNDSYSITANFVPDNVEPVWDWYDLDAVRNDLTSSYILMNDLDSTSAGYTELASTTANGGKGWQPIGTYNTTFTGTFDGQGYEIQDLYINRPHEEHVALFGFVGSGAVTRNIGVVNFNVTGGYGVGGLAGWNEGNMTACYATGSVTGLDCVGGLVGVSCGPLLGGSRQDTITHCYATGSVTGENGVGGLVGAACGDVTNCYAVGSVTGEWYVGGLAGGIGGPELGCVGSVGSLSNSYAKGDATGNMYVGGLVGFNEGPVTNCYSVGNVIGDEDVGGLVGDNWGTVSNSFWDIQTSGQTTSAGGTGKNTTEMHYIATFSGAGWDIVVVSSIGERNPAYIWNIVDEETYPFLAGMVGCGPPSQNLEIQTWYDLDAIRDNLSGNHILMNDLDSTTPGYVQVASSTANEGAGWQPIGTLDDSFDGIFDGQGYEIRDLFINRPDEYSVGLFGVVDEGGRIENIGVVNATVTGGEAVGGLVGDTRGTVSNSYSTGSVSGDDDVGGLVGWNYGSTVRNSYSTSSVTGNTDVGGLVGDNWGTVSNSFWDIQTSGQATSDGGTGKTTEEMQSITTFSGAGWDICAVAPGSTNSTHTWNIVDDETYPFLAGLVGCGPSQNLEIRDWYDLDAIRDNLSGNHILMNDLDSTTPGYVQVASSTANEGAGWQPIGTNENSPFAGAFDGQGHEIHDLLVNHPNERNTGLFGVTYKGVVIKNIGVVNVTLIGDEHVGGLVAWNMGTISDSYSSGNVSGRDDVGGMVGWNDSNGIVSNSYSTASVSGDTDVGGLVGDNWGIVSNSYSTGNVTGWGGLVGAGGGAVSNSFWDMETSGQATSDGGIGKNTTEMQDILTFTDTETEGLDEPWDIMTVANPGIRNLSYIWNIVDDETYPFLSWQP